LKRRYLLKHLVRNGCIIFREGKKHTVVQNLASGVQTDVPRHREIKTTTARSICKILGVEPPSEK
jgi:mRNA interferase HicA